MEATILKLSKQANGKNLKEYFEQQSLNDIAQVLRKKLANNVRDDIDPLLIVRAIFIGSPANGGETCTQRRSIVFQEAMAWYESLYNEDIATTTEKAQVVNNLVNILLPEVETVPLNVLSQAALDMAHAIQQQTALQPKMMEIFAKLWNVLSTAEVKDSTNEIIKCIGVSKWHPQLTVSLASAFNDMELTSQQLEEVVTRIFRQLNDLDVEEIPPVIYQLLLLTRKGHKRMILAELCGYFNRIAKTNTNNPAFSRMEGTVMLHISFAIKQDQDLGQELVKYMKSNKMHLMETFNLACLLSAARIHRLEDTIFDLIKSNIVAIYKDTEKVQKCAWITEFCHVDGTRVRQILLDIVDKSASGWDQVIQSITQLGMILIDTANQSAWLRTSVAAPTRVNRHHQGPMEIIASLGIEILTKMFQASEILDQITSRIVSRSPSAMHFLELLDNVITTCADGMDAYLNNIKDTLDYLSFLPHATAERLLKAILPVAQANQQFRDGLILVLRKSMFAKDVDGRKVSVNGFLNLLRAQLSTKRNNAAGSSSSRSMSSDGVAFEILGLLRRCFSQQAEIRAIAYNGLGDLAHQHSVLATDIFDILYSQFLKVYEMDTGVATPLKLDACIENALTGGYPKMVEPVHILLFNLLKTMRILAATSHNEVTMTTLETCRDAIASLTFRLSKSDLEDYELDKTSNLDMATHLGLRNKLYSNLLLGCYETAIEHEFITKGDDVESFELILNIFKKRKALMTLLKENATNEKGRKLASHQHSGSMFTLEFITTVTKALFLQGNVQTPVRSLRSDIDFIHFIISNTQSSLLQAVNSEWTDFDDDHFKNCVELGQVFMHILMTEDSDSSFINHQPKKGHSVLGTIIESTKVIFETTVQIWPERFVRYLDQLLTVAAPNIARDGSSSRTTNKILSDTVAEFKDIMTKYLADQGQLYKEAASVMQIIVFLWKKLDRTATDFTKYATRMVNWLDEFARERPIEDVTIAKEMIALLIQASTETASFDIVVSLAKDIHTLMGDLEATTANSQSDQPAIVFVLINPKTHGVITMQLLSFVDQSADDMFWCINRLKLCATGTNVEDEVVLEFERGVCARIMCYLTVVSELTKAVLSGTFAENLIKVLSKIYKMLAAFVKYKLLNPKMISKEFSLLIMMAGEGVTDKMYKFLTVHGQRQDEVGSGGRKKGKKIVSAKEKAKVLREAKMIPHLIFLVEHFERHLIQLTRKSKVDLMQYMKRSTARDFKINLAYIDENDSSEDEKQIAKRSNPGVNENAYDDDEAEEGINEYPEEGEEAGRRGGRRATGSASI
ncbi:FANCI solenoid 4-domain-containing protein [Radiomyces spectabilis]|uniref:FANCI solenoid 4-domain-containing protein n=1 Tax=Radiomyces spectabilis TaxID=64574 RepID=UPI0022210870|nr:FANCI solenoid 4-domain-containing protein [Radiomyces spectabilis]KAI8381247.1 FANCI solenoid 4-domain-containing protein [Radiomyces spectabilis]